MADFYVRKITEVQVNQDGIDVVLVLKDGKFLELPWDAALILARAITIQARRIEETVKANQIIGDQALLMRLGIPLGLTSNPKMIDEAAKKAAWDSYLRRMCPGGVKSQEAFGTPTLIQHEPEGGGDDHKAI